MPETVKKGKGETVTISPEGIVAESCIFIEGEQSVPPEELDKILQDAPVVDLGSGKIDESMAESIQVAV